METTAAHVLFMGEVFAKSECCGLNMLWSISAEKKDEIRTIR